MLERMGRRYYQQWMVDPIAILLSERISANAITWLSGLFGVLVLPVIQLQHTLFATGLLLLSGYCDTLDGTLARLTYCSTAWGSALDIMMDRFVEFVVIFALWGVNPNGRALWCLLMLGSILLCITSFLVVGIFVANDSQKSFHYSPGIIERPEAFIFFIAMILWPEAFVFFAALFIFLVTATAIIRLYEFYQRS